MARQGTGSIEYGGITLPSLVHTDASVRYAHQSFQVRDSDVFNLTYPKSGTTWMQEILSLIYSNGDLTLSRSVPSWERVPWIEQTTAAEYLENRPSPRLITSHLPPTVFPASFFASQAKAIYTVRDPRDVCVSLYYYAKMSSFLEYKESFGEFIEMFAAGTILFGSWFDHVKGWLAYRNRKNFLLLTYDDLLQDLRGTILRICQFLGKDLDTSAVDTVVANASFEAMKGNKMVNYSLVPEDIMNQKISPFLRKGISGDWKNHFTPEQSSAFHHLYQQKMKEVDIRFPWDDL
ncbi:sulfotransferase 2B1-like isoform X2 [Sphaerodactylus townsendi]|uniref:sulfotransferase 2B1-like isoform X2 n=2 Tax=Sphaerodactylus townsendi TaxID=933632 RepID=UPI002026E409|nr:sulfotransferase 2B1-like isoform X2 [Sphaerodactylus townsendi]XP_048374021.1 sulfotransferase 2B1-like isoform X2 [Sphaerodactylus townsendi]XP_048374022.1 sulfotransferase 2B1-like isoform X2 [Sphaerodactylus townsendi]XP_048374023.1 sulfotransferase 2B1-like isoform X2 [Sphaerodactylus townsendi]XP_048374024.1 sulfotransferase 2B1-like isoform X2 [Sphaerodactylus townsendi]